jgi:hypothetical protein
MTTRTFPPTPPRARAGRPDAPMGPELLAAAPISSRSQRAYATGAALSKASAQPLHVIDPRNRGNALQLIPPWILASLAAIIIASSRASASQPH